MTRDHTPAPAVSPSPAARYLSVRDAAALLGLSTSYLNKLRVRGDGPRFYRLGRAVRYLAADLDAWAAAGARRSTSDREAA